MRPAPSSAPSAPVSRSDTLLQRFFPLYCVLTATVTFLYALYDTYQVDGDAIAYMDLGDYLRAHNWPAIVNGYWHPLYPAVLSLFHGLLHATLANELRAYYLANFAIFLLEMAAIVAFTDALARLRLALQPAAPAHFFLTKYPLRYLALALLTFASQRELSLGKIRPDALLQALLLLALAALLTHLASARLRDAALLGLALGLAYLTKSFAFVFALLAIFTFAIFRLLRLRHTIRRILPAAALALATFALVAGPYIAALSHQKHRLTFGDSGTLNMAWYVAGTEKMHLEPWMIQSFGASEVHLKHPESQLLASPPIYSYAQLPYGTNPDWFDPTYWNDQIKPHVRIAAELRRGSRNLVLVLRYLLNHPEGLILLALLLASGARLPLSLRPRAGNPFWLPCTALGVMAWAIYATVNTEERYVTFAYLAIMLPLFAALRTPTAASSRPEPPALPPSTPATVPSLTRHIAGPLTLLLALLATGESLRATLELRRQLSLTATPGGGYSPQEQQAAQAVRSLGLRPGDTVACVGYSACLGDFYWARLSQVRILTELYAADTPAYAFLRTLPNPSQALATLQSPPSGTPPPRILVADFACAPAPTANPTLPTTHPDLAALGWQQLGTSTLYELPLNLPPGTVPAPPVLPPHRKPSI